ncbi:lamin tail domain-containing protein [Aquimarina sp. MMG016]|uniref:lamin tail domain-containing protein n=1 Tax=Aquimarina sp. MMG016 TaxID=2822690 RepID=UPI001B3A4301|nr:lamin tail domain-containing protein [Aquimarina sp. MMG016]MBQ4821019.1 lamin tail domain-containing protein [Aquimarina sp. MMG016]
MKKLLLSISLLASCSIFAQGTGEVIITEIHNRPQKPSQMQLDAALLLPENAGFSGDMTPNEGHTEWFEIYNTTASSIDMTGWVIQDESSSSASTVIGSFTLGAGEYAMFTGFYIPDAHGGIIPDYVYDYKKPSFNNESSYSDVGDSACPDGVSIFKADGTTLVDTVEYDYGYNISTCVEAQDTDHDFPPQGGSSRTSFILSPTELTATDNDIAANWSYSITEYETDTNQKGSPGVANNVNILSVSNFTSGKNTKINIYQSGNSLSVRTNDFALKNINIFNIAGQLSLYSKVNDVDIAGLTNGIYILQVELVDNITETVKFIKL